MPYSRFSHPRPKSKTKKRSKKKRSIGTAKPTDGSNASGEVLTDCETSEACSSSQYTESTLPASSENTLGCEEDKGASTDNEFDDSCFMKAVDKALSDVNKLDAIQTDVDCCGTGGEDGGTLTPIAGDLNGSSCTSIATEEDLIDNHDGCSTEINKPMQKGVDASAEVKNSTVFSLIKNSLVITKECHNAIEKKAQSVAQEIPQSGESVVAAKPKNLNGLVKEHHLYKSMMCDDFVAYNTAAIKDAELAYFSRVTKSSESTEEKAKAAPEKSAKPSKSNGKSGNKSAAAAPAAAEKVWTNKAECEAAEAKLQERLAQGEYRNAANGERTFIMLKPDAVHRGLVGTIMDRFESRGFKLLAAKFMKADEVLLREHYADLSKKGFFGELIRYMGSGPVVPMVWQGLNAVKQGRAMLGATNPKDSAPGTIRGDYCVDVGRNIIHGSDSVESAEKEIALWFSPAEISSWRSVMTEWVYEEEELQKPSAAALQGNTEFLFS